MDFVNTCIAEARRLRDTGDVSNLEKCKTKYEEGIQRLLELMGSTSDSGKLEEYEVWGRVYLTEAEDVKKNIAQMQAQIPSDKKNWYGLSSTGRAKSDGKAKPSALTDEELIRRALGQNSQPNKGPVSVAAPRNSNPTALTSSSSHTSNLAIQLTKMEEEILEELLDEAPSVQWDDIKGLELAKRMLQEAVILPNLRPDLFTGLRAPTKGVLLFGPPGTGKTMLAKAVAHESQFSFFSISASVLTSKWVGEGEKKLRALFRAASYKQPSVIFFDEIDSLFSARSDNEAEHSRRLKTEFMVRVDGAASSSEERVLILGATNRPWDLDDAIMRRMPKHIYVDLPNQEARQDLIKYHMTKQGINFQPQILARIAERTNGYSCSDLKEVCREAAMEPIRSMDASALRTVTREEIRPVTEDDFILATNFIKATSTPDKLIEFQRWNKDQG